MGVWSNRIYGGYMTDYRRTIKMLNTAGVAYVAVETPEGGVRLNVHACMGEGNEGEGGLYTSFIFTEDGSLDSMGTWSAMFKTAA
jgi:hypothetical protein